MSQIVLIHGIGQERLSAQKLESAWIPALSTGVRAAGRQGTADRLWKRGAAGDVECRMVFYGGVFDVPGRMGVGGGLGELSEEQQEIAEELALEWLRRAAARAPDGEDRAEAGRQLAALIPGAAGRQGVKAAGRPVLNGLSRIRWFAEAGMSAASRVAPALTQVTRYLTEEAVWEEVQSRIAEVVGPETVAIVGHSLGSVAAFQAAHRLKAEVPLLLTLGSPLGLRTVVYDRLPETREVPGMVARWVNLADRDDLVAAEPDLVKLFADPRGVLESDWTVDNGKAAHDAVGYLRQRAAGEPVGSVLS